MRTTAIILAAGSGLRMGAGINKAFLELAGQPMLLRTLFVFRDHPDIDDIVLVTRADDVPTVERLVRAVPKVRAVLTGGTERQDSARLALEFLAADGMDAEDRVLIHDGARPMVSGALLTGCLAALEQEHAVIPAMPVKETVKQVCCGAVVETVDRSRLHAVQTPQAFRFGAIYDAHGQAFRDRFTGTDDASLIERIGGRVGVIAGEATNIKVTTPEDVPVAEWYLREGERVMSMKLHNLNVRTGIGYDVHRLVPGRALILGGVAIPHPLGLFGHSDADVLIHAIIDALLGGAGLGDIGRLFPDTDPAYEGADSLQLLSRVGAMLSEKGYGVISIDAVVVAQKPRIAGFASQMEANIAAALKMPAGNVNVKGKSTEGLGFEGRGEGISSQAVAMLIGTVQ